jgi:dTDP-4-amino-4,6-dideoxygalactose transaminase
MALANERDLYIIEDAAQSLGARQQYDGAQVQSGTVAHLGCYSFFPSKNLGGFGDGGMIVTDDDALTERLLKLRVHGGRQMYHHEMVGTNSRLDALQAAVLAAKLPHLDGWAIARRKHAHVYDSAFADHDAIQTPHVEPGNHHVFNQYTLRVQKRDALKERLDKAGVGNAIYYPVPLHMQECFASLGFKRGDLPEAEKAAHEAISIPVFPELRADEQNEVIELIRNFYR